MASKRPQRIRYNWQDLPRNVSRREYGQFQLRLFGAIATGGLSFLFAFLAITGKTLQTSNELAKIPILSVADAATTSGTIELVKLSGFLVADNPPIMPDDPSLKVIRGEVKLTVRDEAVRDEVAVTEVLLSWSADADPIFLSDGETRIPLAIDITQFPLLEAAPDFDAAPRVKSTGSARISKPRAIAYAGKEFPLDMDKWGNADSAFTDLERKVLPYGQSVVVVVGIRNNQLVDPLGDRLKIELGTESDIRASGQRLRLLFGIFWLPMAIACYFLAKSVNTLNQEFIRRSNE